MRLNVPGLPATAGQVEFVGHPHFVGVRTGDGMHLFIRGYRDAIAIGYHGFAADADAAHIETAWRAWLASAAATPT